MEKNCLLSSAYWAPVQYYAKLYAYPGVWVEAWEHYVKQTYRNRCLIASPAGVQALTVPVVKPDTDKCPMKDIRISDHGNWRHLHWNALVSAYHMSPFFEYYEEDFAPFYEKRYDFLMDFNEALCETVCRLIDIQPRIERTSVYESDVSHDFREVISPKRRTEDPEFRPASYYQVFRDKWGFLPNLSIVDLLFNMGPESVLMLKASIQRE